MSENRPSKIFEGWLLGPYETTAKINPGQVAIILHRTFSLGADVSYFLRFTQEASARRLLNLNFLYHVAVLQKTESTCSRVYNEYAKTLISLF